MDMGQLGPDTAGVAPVVRPDDDLTALLGPQPDFADSESGEEMQIQEMPDGSVIVMDAEEEEERKDPDFTVNLAEVWDEHYLQTLGSEIDEAVKSDKRVREERDKQYAEGIRRTGLGADAPGGASFDGASRAVSPMLSKGCVDFASRAIKELFPATGPCKTQIIGEANDSKVDRAERKRQYMNWQLTTQVQENRAEFERLLSQLPLGGSQYKRWWWDDALQRPRTQTVYVDDVFLPYGQADFYSSPRVTHRQYVSREMYEERIASGLYRDLSIAPPPAGIDDKSRSQQASNKVEGSQEDTAAYNGDGLREIYQVECSLECPDDSYTEGKVAPYIMHLDAWSGRVLGLYRNWKEDDELRQKKNWMVEYNFIPWRGAYGIGLAHLIGSLSASATGAVRAILDSAHIQNFPGGLKLKGGRNSGQSVTVNATELAEIEAPPGADDIRKIVMPFPFNGPSSVLFSLLEWLTQQAESVVATASEHIADGGANMPVGTALALIEHDSTNFSSIHARLHHSLKQELSILHRLNAENLSDEEVVEDLGELIVSVSDFRGPVDIIPVSDPNIFSEAQRFAQMQAVMQISENPNYQRFFKPERLVARLLKLLQFPAPEDVANLPKDPQRLPALEENYKAASDQQIELKAYEEQDDLLHLQAHIQFMTSPIFGASPLVGGVCLTKLVNHCKDHLLALYRKHTRAATDAMMTVAKMQGLELGEEEAQCRAAAFADAAMAQALGPMVMPGLQKSMELVKQMQPQQPPSPDAQAMVQGQIKIAEIKDQGDTMRRKMEVDSEEKRELAKLGKGQATDAMNERIANMTAQLDSLLHDKESSRSILLEEIRGQNQKELLVLQKALEQQLAVLPDVQQQIGQIQTASTQINGALTEQIAALQQQQSQDRQTILDLLTAIQQQMSPPQPQGV